MKGTPVERRGRKASEPRSATVVACTACHLVPIPQAQFDLLVRETPEFARYNREILDLFLARGVLREH